MSKSAIFCPSARLEPSCQSFRIIFRSEFLVKKMKHDAGKSKGKGRSKAVSHKKATRDEINGLLSTVKEFNAKSLEGAKKAAHKDDKLTQLGALPAKQQKMPYAMRLGLNAAKKSREKRVIELAKEAQIQLPTIHVHKQNPSKKRRK